MRIEEKTSICVYFSKKDIDAIKAQPNGWQENALELAAWELLEEQGYDVENIEFVEWDKHNITEFDKVKAIFHKL